MNDELKYIVFNCKMGWVGVLASAEGILTTTLPQSTAMAAQQLLGDGLNQATCTPTLFNDITRRLQAYFSGQEVALDDELDLSRATPFQRLVWETTRLIPYGETRSYAWVAEQIKQPQATRAVGQALGKNPVPIIVPCHRVMASGGQLGGFTGGLTMKRLLLHLEASSFYA